MFLFYSAVIISVVFISKNVLGVPHGVWFLMVVGQIVLAFMSEFVHCISAADECIPYVLSDCKFNVQCCTEV